MTNLYNSSSILKFAIDFGEPDKFRLKLSKQIDGPKIKLLTTAETHNFKDSEYSLRNGIAGFTVGENFVVKLEGRGTYFELDADELLAYGSSIQQWQNVISQPFLYTSVVYSD